MYKVDSAETLAESVRRDQDPVSRGLDTESLVTFNSMETLTNHIFNVGCPVSNYRLINAPIASSVLSPDIHVFRDQDHLNQYLDSESLILPVLSTSSSFLNYFKFKAPFLSIHKYDSNGNKIEFCRSYFKLLKTNLSCYILIFDFGSNDKRVCLLLNNEFKPHVDLVWESTKLRITGTSGASSTFGNGLIKVFALTGNYNTLADGIQVNFKTDISKVQSPKDISIILPDDNELINNTVSQNKTFITKNLENSSTLINVPVGMFTNDNSKRKKHVMNGSLKVLDRPGDSISSNGLVIMSILLVLREQETRKNRGNNKPTYK